MKYLVIEKKELNRRIKRIKQELNETIRTDSSDITCTRTRLHGQLDTLRSLKKHAKYEKD